MLQLGYWQCCQSKYSSLYDIFRLNSQGHTSVTTKNFCKEHQITFYAVRHQVIIWGRHVPSFLQQEFA